MLSVSSQNACEIDGIVPPVRISAEDACFCVHHTECLCCLTWKETTAFSLYPSVRLENIKFLDTSETNYCQQVTAAVVVATVTQQNISVGWVKALSFLNGLIEFKRPQGRVLLLKTHPLSVCASVGWKRQPGVGVGNGSKNNFPPSNGTDQQLHLGPP